MKTALLILGDQLFSPAKAPLKGRKFDRVFMREGPKSTELAP